MPSSLTWLDHDPAARDRSLRILALFREKESRDELGIGGIRDAISDRLFPGTSTIQTRLRYMLLVPWIYEDLERKKIPSSSFAARALQAELAMVQPLLDAREEDVFGSQAGSGLKRLPSSVYWAGLGTWGIRRYPGSQNDYHRAVDLLYSRRVQRRRRDDDDDDDDATSGARPGTRACLPLRGDSRPTSSSPSVRMRRASSGTASSRRARGPCSRGCACMVAGTAPESPGSTISSRTFPNQHRSSSGMRDSSPMPLKERPGSTTSPSPSSGRMSRSRSGTVTPSTSGVPASIGKASIAGACRTSGTRP